LYKDPRYQELISKENLSKFGFSVKDIEEENDILRVKNEEF